MIFGDPANPAVNSLHTELSRLLADKTLDFYSAEDRAIWLNRAYQELNSRIRPIRKYQSTVLPPNSGTLTLPTDFLGLESGGFTFEFDNEPGGVRFLEHRSVADLDFLLPGWQTADPGRPDFYFLEPGSPSVRTVTVIPRNRSSGALRFQYTAAFPDMTNVNDVPWAGEFVGHHQIIANLAEVFARQLEQNTDAEKIALQRVAMEEDRFKRAITDYAPQQVRTPRANQYRRTFGGGS